MNNAKFQRVFIGQFGLLHFLGPAYFFESLRRGAHDAPWQSVWDKKKKQFSNWKKCMKVFRKMANNIWQHMKSIPLDALKTKVEYYQHKGTGMGLHIANVPGPICTCLYFFFHFFFFAFSYLMLFFRYDSGTNRSIKWYGFSAYFRTPCFLGNLPSLKLIFHSLSNIFFILGQ